MPLYISASDIVIAPFKNLNKNYGTPVKIFESLSCQTPTFVPDIPEFRIWFGNYLEYYRSLDDLITKIDYVLNQYDNIIYKLKQAREYIKENFDWEKLADKYENIIKLL
ncbi:glycosyltransferase [Pyrobaculum sp.]|uniref:glycosyltransferase n=1 Tax=Pyrobaculum sp. TaxID=2004705 RepID=UPI00386217CE